MLAQPFAVPSLLLFVAALPLVLKIVPRNRYYGVRTPKTLAEDRIWYPVNRLAGGAIAIGSSLYGLVAFLMPYDRLAGNDLAIWGLHLAAFILPLGVGLAVVVWYSRRL